MFKVNLKIVSSSIKHIPLLFSSNRKKSKECGEVSGIFIFLKTKKKVGKNIVSKLFSNDV